PRQGRARASHPAAAGGRGSGGVHAPDERARPAADGRGGRLEPSVRARRGGGAVVTTAVVIPAALIAPVPASAGASPATAAFPAALFVPLLAQRAALTPARAAPAETPPPAGPRAPDTPPPAPPHPAAA